MVIRASTAWGIVLMLCSSLVFFGCRAEVTQAQSSSIIRDYAGANLPQERWGWVNEQWTGDDRPFQKIGVDITASLKGGQNSSELAAKYRVKAIASPNDPKAVYAWAYAVQAYTDAIPNSTQSRMMWFRVREALDKPPSPHAYTYDRLRFLLAYDKTHIISLGERLLERNPTDEHIKFQLIYAYISNFGSAPLTSEGAAAKFKTRALQLTNDLIKAKPKDSDYRAALGNIYVASLDRHYRDKHYNREDAVKALAAWQDYQRIAKPQEDFYRESFTMIKSMNEFLQTGDLK